MAQSVELLQEGLEVQTASRERPELRVVGSGFVRNLRNMPVISGRWGSCHNGKSAGGFRCRRRTGARRPSCVSPWGKNEIALTVLRRVSSQEAICAKLLRRSTGLGRRQQSDFDHCVP